MARFRPALARLIFVLSILGPGFITANVDNDAGGIYTYALAGAQFGYALLWTIIPVAICLTFAQEISARMGVATGKGLSELIREQYGLRITFFLMCALVLCNIGDVVSEFAGVASSVQLFGVSKYISVPIAGALVWLLVVLGNYKRLEKIFVFLSFLYIAYIVTAVVAHPDWSQALMHIVRVPRVSELKDSGYLYLAVGIIGATIAPWQQFYLQASIVDKGTPESHLKYSRTDAIVGSLFSVLVAGFIVIACAATLFSHGRYEIHDAADAAASLRPLGGEYAYLLFAIGLLNASLFAASILPLSTAYTVCEALGFESGLNKKFREAPAFYWLYTGLLIIGAAVILVPNAPLIKLAVLSQVLNGVLLPFVLVFMLMLVNKRGLMGRHVNSRLYNTVAWSLTGIIVVLTGFMLLSQYQS
ncbi:MAG TPA: Nramp family divalent metal transporter [Candidatus Acidoferrales bacterium]|nr:Nramp family divalent metal transporter [Candidatus Acidoferrales bacterium]